jgi:hypothetical protein
MLIIPCSDNGEPSTSYVDGLYCPVFFWPV